MVLAAVLKGRGGRRQPGGHGPRGGDRAAGGAARHRAPHREEYHAQRLGRLAQCGAGSARRDRWRGEGLSVTVSATACLSVCTAIVLVQVLCIYCSLLQAGCCSPHRSTVCHVSCVMACMAGTGPVGGLPLRLRDLPHVRGVLPGPRLALGAAHAESHRHWGLYLCPGQRLW